MSGRRLREMIRIEEIDPTSQEDAHGDIDERDDANWRLVVRIAAEVEELNGREYQHAHQQQADLTHRVRVRACKQLAGVNPRMRIVWGGRVLNVEAAVYSPRKRRFVEFQCKERR